MQASLQVFASEWIVIGDDENHGALATAAEIERFKDHVRLNGFGGRPAVRKQARARIVSRQREAPPASKTRPLVKRTTPTRRAEVVADLPALLRDARPVVIIGGEDHQQKLDRIVRRTRIAIEWCGCEDGERIARRVREHHLAGLVVLDGLGGHSKLATLMKAARENNLPLAYANKGGIESIVLALRKIDARFAVRGPIR